jgi:hypothetical protein
MDPAQIASFPEKQSAFEDAINGDFPANGDDFGAPVSYTDPDSPTTPVRWQPYLGCGNTGGGQPGGADGPTLGAYLQNQDPDTGEWFDFSYQYVFYVAGTDSGAGKCQDYSAKTSTDDGDPIAPIGIAMIANNCCLLVGSDGFCDD